MIVFREYIWVPKLIFGTIFFIKIFVQLLDRNYAFQNDFRLCDYVMIFGVYVRVFCREWSLFYFEKKVFDITIFHIFMFGNFLGEGKIARSPFLGWSEFLC